MGDGPWVEVATTVFSILLVIAALIDARTRRFPNALAVATALTAVALVSLAMGCAAIPSRIMVALATCFSLVAFELLWRHLHDGAMGMGFGDLKALFPLLLVEPFAAIISLAVGLALLAICCIALRRPSLPLLPFVVPCYLALLIPASSLIELV
ncbi:MAG: prepilin peptidase [Collinsella sp.]|nr:prepilin peptidase [Collinsella sp.]